MAKSKGERVKITVRMPSYLSRRLSALALAEGLSINEYMVARLTAAADRESFNHILRTMGVFK